VHTDDHGSTIDWIAFGPFLLFPGQRMLKRHGKPVQIGDKALDLLVALIKRPGEILSKRELAEQVWRREWVEDVNLRVTIASLRKLLGPAPANMTPHLELRMALHPVACRPSSRP
jgi:DNA-binding winged helix-turn-helix (wHTH) protein